MLAGDIHCEWPRELRGEANEVEMGKSREGMVVGEESAPRKLVRRCVSSLSAAEGLRHLKKKQPSSFAGAKTLLVCS